MEKSLQFCRNIDQEEITNENREFIRNDMEKAADNYVDAREEFNKIDTDFKDMKLYEAFGESAPQAQYIYRVSHQLVLTFDFNS